MPQTSIQLLLQLAQQKQINTLDAELIISHILQKPREFVLAHREYKIPINKINKIKKLLTARGYGTPLAYLTGKKEFFGLDFVVNKNVLIPRPDTELIVEEVLQELRIKNRELRTTLIDVGTGSGCIPISILKNLKSKNITTFAIDISSKTLAVARKNARLLKTKINFLRGDLLEPFLNNCHPEFISGSFSRINKKKMLKQVQHDNLIITANLPYLTQKQFKQEPSIQHEPKLALVAGKEGLKYYHQLLKQLTYLNTYTLTCFFEIDPSQTSSIKKLIKKCLPQAKIEIKKDLAGLDRVIIIKI